MSGATFKHMLCVYVLIEWRLGVGLWLIRGIVPSRVGVLNCSIAEEGGVTIVASTFRRVVREETSMYLTEAPPGLPFSKERRCNTGAAKAT